MTEIVVTSPKRNRLYVRKFDHDEARRRHAAGETVRALSEEYGVHYNAVLRAVRSQEYRDSELVRIRKKRTVTCEVCGGPAMKIGAQKRDIDGRTLCLVCRKKEARERVRFDEQGTLVAVRCNIIDCANGERWQPPENFSKGTKFPDLREGGFHTECRSCNTRARRAYRARHRVPCEDCGTPVEGAGRANHKAAADRPYLCHPCWHKRRAAA